MSDLLKSQGPNDVMEEEKQLAKERKDIPQLKNRIEREGITLYRAAYIS